LNPGDRMTDTNSSKYASRAQGISPLTVSLGFAKTIADIAATAAAREREHRLPHDESRS